MATPAPERRVRGYVVVLVLISVALLAALPALFFRPTLPAGPTVLLVVAGDTIAMSPATASVPADFGPRCSDYAWDPQRALLSVEADADLGGAQGLLLQHFFPVQGEFVSDSRDRVRPVAATDGTAWQLTSPIDGRVLLVLAVDGDRVRIAGASYGPGESWSLRFEYEVFTSDGAAVVTEDLAFQNEGLVSSRIVPSQACV